MKLNIGCGEYKLQGYVNIDAQEEVGPDLVAEAWSLPFEDNSVSEIYAGHVYEHMTKEDGNRALREFHRVLKPGGLLTVVIPDARKAAKEYLIGTLSAEETFGILSGAPGPPPGGHARMLCVSDLCGEMKMFQDVKVLKDWTNLPMVSHIGWQSVARGAK